MLLLQKAEEKNATLLPLMERRIGSDRSNQPQKQVRLLLMQEEFPRELLKGAFHLKACPLEPGRRCFGLLSGRVTV